MIHKFTHLTHVQRAYAWMILGGLVIGGILIAGLLMPEQWYAIDYQARNLEPSWAHPFGTDHMGRDMFFRVIKGLSLGLIIGLGAAFMSSIISLILGILSATFGGKVDAAIVWLVDVFLGIPHLLLIMMISVTLGGGLKGVMMAIILTHWPHLTRVIRAEVMQMRKEPYVLSARNYGKSYWQIAASHIAPHVLPHYVIGLTLMFPLAILHEAGISFLGYGLPLEMPGIGIILSESIKHVTMGLWWLAFFPGILLMVVVIIFNQVGEALNDLFDPMKARG